MVAFDDLYIYVQCLSPWRCRLDSGVLRQRPILDMNVYHYPEIQSGTTPHHES